LRQEAPARPDSLRAVLGAAVLFFSVLLVFASVKSHRDLAAARGHQRDLERTIHDTRERIETLRGRIDRLRRDPDTLERLAREELGMVRPTDVVIVLPAPAPPAPPPLAVQARLAAPVAGAAPLPGAAPVASAAQAAAKAAPAPRRTPAAAPQLTPAAPR
jgi:cell division protein FtsB